MPTSNSVGKDVKKIIDEIMQTPGWSVEKIGGHYQVTNPDGQSVTQSGTPGTQTSLDRFEDDLKKHLGWDPRAAKRLRMEKAQAALAAEKEKNDRLLDEAVAKAAERHAAEMERLKGSLRPGTRLPNGEIVDYVSKPVFFTRVDAIAMLRKVTNCSCNLRPISQVNIQRLGEPMHQGEWLYMPHGLLLCIHGNPGDGKHRLKTLAEMTDEELIEKYGENGLWFRVTYNVPPEMLDYTDTGRARNAADVLVQHGYDLNPKETAAALNFLLSYDKGIPWRHWGRQVYTNGMRLNGLEDKYAELVNPGKEHTVQADAWKLHKGTMKMTLTSALMFCFLIQRTVPYPVWNEFLHPLLTLKGFEDIDDEDDPRISLYNNLVKNERKAYEARRTIRELGMALKTWNKWATGEKQSLATFKKTEPMPKVLKISREIPALAKLHEPFTV